MQQFNRYSKLVKRAEEKLNCFTLHFTCKNLIHTIKLLKLVKEEEEEGIKNEKKIIFQSLELYSLEKSAIFYVNKQI